MRVGYDGSSGMVLYNLFIERKRTWSMKLLRMRTWHRWLARLMKKLTNGVMKIIFASVHIEVFGGPSYLH